jgi:hypothetical protein
MTRIHVFSRPSALTSVSAALAVSLFTLSAQAQTSASGAITTYKKPAGIIAPIDASALKGRVGSVGTATSSSTAMAKPKTATTAVLAPRPPVMKAPTVGRGDEDSYRERGMLPKQVAGNNRFGGNTYTLPADSLAVDFEDALAGFASFDKLGTLREKKVYRANGTSVTNTYDPRSGDLQDSKTDTPSPTADISAGGVVVMPGTSLSGLIQQGVPSTVAPAAPASSASTGGSGTVQMEGVNRLIPPTAR